MENTENQKEKCETCGKSASLDPHPCPFNEDVHNDSVTLCNCCENCQYECSQDI